MIRELLTTVPGCLVLFGLLVGAVLLVGILAELHIRLPRPQIPRWIPRPVSYRISILLSYVLIAWMAVRADGSTRRRPPADMRRDRY